MCATNINLVFSLEALVAGQIYPSTTSPTSRSSSPQSAPSKPSPSVLSWNRYGFTKGGDNITIWTAGQQRVVDTATYFARGYLSQGNYLSNTTENRANLIIQPDSVNYTFANSLTPSAACPLYESGDTSSVATTFRASYQPQIANRLNQYLDGLTLNATDIGVMQDLCGFETSLNGNSQWCDVFEDEEWLDYEYADDLNYYYGSGPGNPFSATVGFPWVKAVSELFALGPNETTPGALGLWNTSVSESVYPLSLTAPDPRRKFRSSYIVAFRGYVALERLACTTTPANTTVFHLANTTPDPVPTELFVRVRFNRAPFVIPGCTSGPGSTCPLADFTQYVQTTRAAAAGDFVQMCGLQNISNATSDATFFTVVDPESLQTVVPLNYVVGTTNT
ncbi:Phosphoglycerate mutase-like protein [Mycena chlorophos]|uniref:Phosphoglycerate mutase-like protein n=1 Tax=Mycena chlorophos TaxID=658473 RepID=A0A8H6TVC4_MYCCL|nr:Phosphoglycerate mutase-like protein [Mycena chlorophos]